MNIFFILIVKILIGFTLSKYVESPAYKFAYDTTNDPYWNIRLSPDGDQLLIYSLPKETKVIVQEIYNFDGTKNCSIQFGDYRFFLGWPLKTRGLYFNWKQLLLVEKLTGCSEPQNLTMLQSTYSSYSFRNTSNKSYVTFLTYNRRVYEYDVETGSTRNFTLEGGDVFSKLIMYSPNHKYLYVELYNTVPKTIQIYDSQTFKKIRQMENSMQFVIGNSDGKSFIGFDSDSGYVYNVKENSKTQIFNFDLNDPQKNAFIVCFRQREFVTVEKNQQEGQMILKVWSTVQKKLIQNFTIQIEEIYGLDCNDRYLSLLNSNGEVQIYRYVKPDPQPQPDPQPIPPGPDNFPIWIIILIIIFILLMICCLIICILKKRQPSVPAFSYRKFKNEPQLREILN